MSKKRAWIIVIAAIVIIGIVAAVLFFALRDTRAVAATVGDTKIYEEDVTSYVERQRSQMSLTDDAAWANFMAQNSLTPETVRSQVIDALVAQELIRQGAAELGITVQDSDIEDYISSGKAAYESDEDWIADMEEAGFTEETYRESVADMLLQQKTYEHFQEGAQPSEATLSDAAADYAQRLDGSKRSAHILFGVSDTSDEAAMQEARDKAQDVLDQLKDGSIEFADAAPEYSDDASSAASGGDVGWDKLNTFVAAYQDALDKLKVGELSGLVETGYGVHIILCTDQYKAPKDVSSIDQLPDNIQGQVTAEATEATAQQDYNNWLQALRDKIAIVINDMPADVPYNIEPATADSAAAAESAASADSAASAEPESSESAESTTANSASADSASADSSSTE